MTRKQTERVHLTLARIEKLTAPDGKQAAYVFDDDPKQFCVRVTPTGAKSFVLSSKLGTNPVRITIGDCASWLLDKARDEARRLQTLIDQGIDPRQEKAARLAKLEAEREQTRRGKEPAFAAWDAYVSARKSDWGERHLRNHEKLSQAGGKPKTRGRKKGEGDTTEPGPLHELLQRPLADITPEVVKSWLEKNNTTRPTWTAQGYRALRAFLTWCASQPEYQSAAKPDACTAPETRRKVAKNLTKDDDCLQREQLPLWFEYVRKLPNPVHAAYLQALLLTGARREELAGLKWVDVDFQWASITIRDKVEGERTIPLTPYVASLIAPLARRNQWVFSSPKAASGRLQEPRDPHNKALSAAGLPHLSLHGLRRSFGTLCEWVEAPAGISAQIMGHKPSALAEKHYRRRPLDLLRKWHTKIEAWILEQAGIEQPNQGEAAPGLRVVGG